jgi:hypothetical protein
MWRSARKMALRHLASEVLATRAPSILRPERQEGGLEYLEVVFTLAQQRVEVGLAAQEFARDLVRWRRDAAVKAPCRAAGTQGLCLVLVLVHQHDLRNVGCLDVVPRLAVDGAVGLHHRRQVQHRQRHAQGPATLRRVHAEGALAPAEAALPHPAQRQPRQHLRVRRTPAPGARGARAAGRARAQHCQPAAARTCRWPGQCLCAGPGSCCRQASAARRARGEPGAAG